jgi:hypothetical protein
VEERDAVGHAEEGHKELNVLTFKNFFANYLRFEIKAGHLGTRIIVAL